MRDLNDLYFFVRVVDHAGFAPAARALGIPKSRLSRRVQALEDRLGARLIHRSTRRFSVTEAGQEVYRHATAMLVEADAAEEAIARQRSEPQGIVRFSCPTALLYFQVADMVARYMAAHPRVEVHLESTNRRVDVIAEGLDFAIRVRFPPIEESDLVMRRLGPSPQRLVAAPALLEDLPGPLTPADLSALPSLDLGPPHREHRWRLEGPDGATAEVAHAPRLVTDDMVALCFAASHGLGVVQLPTMMAAARLAEGLLVDVLPDWAPRGGVVHAVFPSRRGLLPSVRSLIDFLAVEFGKLN